MIRILRQYIINLLVLSSQFLNTLLLGDPDETLSSRIGREYPNSFLCKVIDALFWKGHCKEAVEDDNGKPIVR